MIIDRRSLLLGMVGGGMVLPLRARAAADPIRIGVLRFGSVAWELDVLRRDGPASGADFVTQEFASSQATQVALQAGAVDMVALDFFWVSRRRGSGADFTFAPLSSAIGALEVPAASPIKSAADLAGKRLGIAGTPLDKSWLILRAYAKRTFGLDLDKSADKQFAAPPLLSEEMKAGRIDCMLNFWPYAAKAEASGTHRLLALDDAVTALGVASAVPMVGYVFSERWAARRRPAVDRFLAAAQQAREILGRSDAEWQRIAPLTGTTDPAVLERLKAWYRRGIPNSPLSVQRQAAAQLYDVLASIGGPSLVGGAAHLTPGTFWGSA